MFNASRCKKIFAQGIKADYFECSKLCQVSFLNDEASSEIGKEKQKLKEKVASSMMLAILSIGMLTLIFKIQSVETGGTIYIRADGSIDPPTAPIYSADKVTYTFTDDIYDSVVVERSNIVVDGSIYILRGTGSGEGIRLWQVVNVTIRNMEIKAFTRGLYLYESSYNYIVGNKITNNGFAGIDVYRFADFNRITLNEITNNENGISLHTLSNNSIVRNSIRNNGQTGIVLTYVLQSDINENTIMNNHWYGIQLYDSSSNNIAGNNITENNYDGIQLYSNSKYNIIVGNNILKNTGGISLLSSSLNKIYRNNFIDNIQQVPYPEVNIWDDGYPSGGNHWSNYTGEDLYSGPNQDQLGSDGIGDTPHIIDANNRDRYPLMDPWKPVTPTTAVFYVTWKETIYSITVFSNSAIEGFTFNHSLGHLTFNVTGPIGIIGFCNVTVPKQLFDGAFRVQVDDISTGSVLTWNNTHTSAYFTYSHTAHKAKVVGEIVTPILGDVNRDGKVDVYDLFQLSKNYGKTDP